MTEVVLSSMVTEIADRGARVRTRTVNGASPEMDEESTFWRRWGEWGLMSAVTVTESAARQPSSS